MSLTSTEDWEAHPPQEMLCCHPPVGILEEVAQAVSHVGNHKLVQVPRCAKASVVVADLNLHHVPHRGCLEVVLVALAAHVVVHPAIVQLERA